jgi:hypothetical protein
MRYEAVNAMLLNEFLKEHRTVQKQQKEIDALKGELKEQRALIQKVNDKMELNRSAPQTEPAAGYALLLHPARHVFLNLHAADDPRVAHCNEHRATRVGCDPELKRNRTELIARSSIISIHDGKVDRL